MTDERTQDAAGSRLSNLGWALVFLALLFLLVFLLMFLLGLARAGAGRGATPPLPWTVLAVRGLLISILVGVLLLGAVLVRHGVRGRTRLPPWASTLGLGLLVSWGLFFAVLLGMGLAERPHRPPREGTAWSLVATAALSTIGFLVAALLWGTVRGRPRAVRDRFSGIGLAALPALALLAVVGMGVPSTRSTVGHREPRSMRNARILTVALLLSAGDREGRWPPYGGKNFVLSLVTDGSIDIRNMQNVEALFTSEGDRAHPRPGREAYEEVQESTLSRRRFPTLTDFAGRRNDESRYRLPPGEGKGNEPILACRCEDGVVVGFDDGQTMFMTRKALGLAPEDAIVFGEGSRSPLLEKLSDR